MFLRKLKTFKGNRKTYLINLSVKLRNLFLMRKQRFFFQFYKLLKINFSVRGLNDILEDIFKSNGLFSINEGFLEVKLNFINKKKMEQFSVSYSSMNEETMSYQKKKKRRRRRSMFKRINESQLKLKTEWKAKIKILNNKLNRIIKNVLLESYLALNTPILNTEEEYFSAETYKQNDKT